MNTQDIFIPYELAKELKELGFDKDGLAIWIPTCNFLLKDISQEEADLYFWGYVIPTWEQAFKFFRDNYKASPVITCYSELGNAWKYHIPNEGGKQGFYTYEEARLESLKHLIKIVKNDNYKISS